MIEGILFRRDLISLTGRRRSGKTTFLHNLAVAGALGHDEYLGFKISGPFKTVSFYLEDDGGEIQEKLRRMMKGEKAENFHLYTRTDFAESSIPISVKEPRFKTRVIEACSALNPDLIVFDNLGMLISAKYNDADEIHLLMDFVYRLAQRFNAAVLISAHPRKGSRIDKFGDTITLADEPEKFESSYRLKVLRATRSLAIDHVSQASESAVKAGRGYQRIATSEFDIERVTEIVRIVKAEIRMIRIAHIDADEAKLLGG